MLPIHEAICDPFLMHVRCRYLESIMGLPYRGKRPANPLPITYTAMHGVGYAYVVAAMEAAGFPKVIPVPEQVSPDPEFPTVEYVSCYRTNVGLRFLAVDQLRGS